MEKIKSLINELLKEVKTLPKDGENYFIQRACEAMLQRLDIKEKAIAERKKVMENYLDKRLSGQKNNHRGELVINKKKAAFKKRK